MMKKQPVIRDLGRLSYYIALGVVVLIVAHIWLYTGYLQKVEEASHTARAQLETIQAYLDFEIGRAHEQNEALEAYILESGDTGEGLLAQMNQRVDEQYGSWLRFGWSNADGMLISGSIGGIFEEPYDLNHRSYVQAARGKPGVIHYDVVEHIYTERPILVFAQGVVDEQGAYLGTMASLLDVGTLTGNVAGMYDAELAQLRMGERNGLLMMEVGLKGFEADIEMQDAQGFITIEAALQPAFKQTILHRYWVNGCLLTLAIIALLLLLRRIQQAYMRGVSRLVIDTLGLETDSSQAVVTTTEQIRDLLQTHLDKTEEVEHYQRQLIEAMTLIRNFQHEQSDFFQSINTEVEAVVDAMEAYGNLVLDQSSTVNHLRGYLPELAAKLHTSESEPFLQLQEVQQNMRFLGQALHAICQHMLRGERAMRVEVLDVVSYIHAHMTLLSDAVEIIFETNWKEQQCELDEEAFSLGVQAMFLLAERYHSDGEMYAKLCATAGDEVRLTLSFVPSRAAHSEETALQAFAVPNAPIHTIKQDVAYFVMRYFARSLNGEAGIASDAERVVLSLSWRSRD